MAAVRIQAFKHSSKHARSSDVVPGVELSIDGRARVHCVGMRSCGHVHGGDSSPPPRQRQTVNHSLSVLLIGHGTIFEMMFVSALIFLIGQFWGSTTRRRKLTVSLERESIPRAAGELFHSVNVAVLFWPTHIRRTRRSMRHSSPTTHPCPPAHARPHTPPFGR